MIRPYKLIYTIKSLDAPDANVPSSLASLPRCMTSEIRCGIRSKFDVLITIAFNRGR